MSEIDNLKIVRIYTELFECSPQILRDVVHIQQILNTAASKSNINVIDAIFHKFNDAGVSGVLLISESHISIHTWPELNYATIDIYTCGSKDKAINANKYIISNLSPQKNQSSITVHAYDKSLHR